MTSGADPMTNPEAALSAEDVAELERLHAAATPGPWRSERTTISVHIHQVNGLHGLASLVIGYGDWPEPDRSRGVKDAALIVAAVNALPRLIADRKRLEDRVAEVEGERDELRLAILGGEDVPGVAATVSIAETIAALNESRAGWQSYAEDRALAAEAALAASQAEVEGLRTALKPFAEAADRVEPFMRGCSEDLAAEPLSGLARYIYASLNDLRAARSALSAKAEPAPPASASDKEAGR